MKFSDLAVLCISKSMGWRDCSHSNSWDWRLESMHWSGIPAVVACLAPPHTSQVDPWHLYYTDPKQCEGRRSGGQSSHRDKTHEHYPQESMPVFSLHMRSKLLPKNQFLGSSAAFACKSHVSICSTRSVLQDLCKVNLPDPLQNSCPRSMRRDSLQNPCLRTPHKIKASESLYRNHVCGASIEDLCKLQDPCSRISAGSMTAGPIQDPCLRTLCKIYVSTSSKRSIPPDPCLRFHTRESSTRCAFPDLCLSILICGPSARSMSQDPLPDPCPRTRYKIRVSGSMSPHICLSVLICGSHMQDPCLWRPHRRPR